MKLIRTSPLSPWTSLDRLASLRDLLEGAVAFPELASRAGWNPPIDVVETNETLAVSLEAAGMKKEDFDISLEGDVLTVTGERKSETESGRGESFRKERFFGRFSRSITLPSAVKADGVTATYEDGVLRIVLPKAEEAKARKIEVQLN